MYLVFHTVDVYKRQKHNLLPNIYETTFGIKIKRRELEQTNLKTM